MVSSEAAARSDGLLMSLIERYQHVRGSYRSFFYPDARWQFLGIRLAKCGS